MRQAVDRLLRRRHAVATREQLLSVLTRNELDDEIRRRRLVALFPRTYCRPWSVDDDAVRHRGALLSVGRPAVLSHMTALRRWGLSVPDTEEVHVIVPVARHPRNVPSRLVVHRVRAPFPPTFVVDGLWTAGIAASLVASWSRLPAESRRGPAIEAVRRQLIVPSELTAAATRRVPCRRDVIELATLLAAGCESELEIWGYLHVFDVPGLRHGARQKWARVRGKRYRLDLAFEEERVVVELDGWTYHESRAQRERDNRRDAALATIGWLTLRFSHDRLHHDVAGCRRDTLATLAARRAWPGAGDSSACRPAGRPR